MTPAVDYEVDSNQTPREDEGDINPGLDPRIIKPPGVVRDQSDGPETEIITLSQPADSLTKRQSEYLMQFIPPNIMSIQQTRLW